MDEQSEMPEKSMDFRRVNENVATNVAPFSETRTSALVTPQAVCGTCGSSGEPNGVNPNDARAISYVYAIGRIEARFPNLAAEKEFAQATKRANTRNKPDQQTFHEVLAERRNRYLVRQLCWVLSIQELDTYLLVPRDPADIDVLVEAIGPPSGPNDIDVVIGMRGPIAPPQMCNGLMVPIVAFDQIYSFDQATLIKNIPKKKTADENFGPVAEELFNRIMQLTDNAGATDEHRALNYLVMRYPAIYDRAAEAVAQDFSLAGVEVRLSPLSGARKIVDVVFAYTHRKSDFTEKFYVRVDVTEEFPFLVTKMSPYFDRQS
jgi:hypothetical protein